VCLLEDYQVGGEVFSAVFFEEMACLFDFDLFARRVCAAENPRITIGRKFSKATGLNPDRLIQGIAGNVWMTVQD
jgi:hypothetical protein